MLGVHGPRRWYKGVFVLLFSVIDVAAAFAVILVVKSKVDEIVADPNGRTYRYLTWMPPIIATASRGL
jgi:hypothetical protein